MTNREKFLSVLQRKSNAKMPIVHFAYWEETIEKWRKEGYLNGVKDNKISEVLGFDFDAGVHFSAKTSLNPYFETKTIEEFSDGSKHIRNGEGVVELVKPGVRSILMEIAHTLVDRTSWEKEYLPKLQFSEDRYDFNALKRYVDSGYPIGLGGGSLYGVIRNWFGIIGLSYIAIDDPELYKEVINTVGMLAYNCVKYGLEKSAELGVKYDLIHFWEDICFKTGPLINPTVFADLVAPYYKKITDLGKEYGISIFMLDCDGCIDALVPIWLDNGVNTMFPIEVGTWGASIKPWRELYGDRVLGVGGMDKRVFAYDRAAIDAEI